eukprot:5810766-Amphidinium_carterae.1
MKCTTSIYPLYVPGNCGWIPSAHTIAVSTLTIDVVQRKKGEKELSTVRTRRYGWYGSGLNSYKDVRTVMEAQAVTSAGQALEKQEEQDSTDHSNFLSLFLVPSLHRAELVLFAAQKRSVAMRKVAAAGMIGATEWHHLQMGAWGGHAHQGY